MNIHFAAAILKREVGGTREYLVIPYYNSEEEYRERRNVQIKFAGGTNKDFPGEPLYDTLRRECVSETGIFIPHRPTQVWVSQPKRKDDGSGFIIQHFFLADMADCRGTLRSEVMNDNGDWLDVPVWMRAEALRKLIFHTHQPAFIKAEQKD